MKGNNNRFFAGHSLVVSVMSMDITIATLIV
ncbi:unnamed protein product, partial [Rotaria magnacalcarata]